MKLGFIGTGNMAGAIMGGIIKNGVLKPEEIIGSDILEAGREKVHSLYGICVTDDNKEAAKAEIVVLSVKPQYYEQTIAQIRDEITDEQVIVTLAPGKTLEWLQGQFGKDVKIVRTMPNTPAMVGAGMTAACANALVTKRRVGKSADNPALFRRGRSRIRASDRCSCVCKRKFSGICIYDDRSNGRCGSGRWNAKTSGV